MVQGLHGDAQIHAKMSHCLLLTQNLLSKTVNRRQFAESGVFECHNEQQKNTGTKEQVKEQTENQVSSKRDKTQDLKSALQFPKQRLQWNIAFQAQNTC